MPPKVLAWPNAGVEVGLGEEEAFAAPLMLESLKGLVGAGLGLGDWMVIVGDAVGVIPPAAAPLMLKPPKDDAAVSKLRRIAGLPSRIDSFKPS